MGDIIIGKNTLESLSTGMYADPRAIYREYIQNATDSIDHAVSAGLMELDDAEIQITIYPYLGQRNGSCSGRSTQYSVRRRKFHERLYPKSRLSRHWAFRRSRLL